MQMLTKSFFSSQNEIAILHFSLKQFFTSMLLLSKMNVNAIFYECNLPFSLQKFLFDVINKLWYDMIDILASFLERSQFDIKKYGSNLVIGNVSSFLFACTVHRGLTICT